MTARAVLCRQRGSACLLCWSLKASGSRELANAQKPSQGGTRRNLHLRYMHEAHDTDTPERYMSDEGLVDLMRWLRLLRFMFRLRIEIEGHLLYS